jgi:hypothetical protein
MLKAPRHRIRNLITPAVAAAAWWLISAGVLHAQVGALVSPGPLSKAHAKLEGLSNCQKCHEPGNGVAAARCLTCHKPIADRIAAKKGVHREAGASCQGCHAEHAGLDAELRPFDTKTFNHAKETGFQLDGRHAPLARDCARCHKTRSFLEARPACASCHNDVHKGTLGTACSSCHSTSVPLADAKKDFDHAKAKFQLTGAHRTVDCAKCHVNKTYTGLKFGACTDCHREPHKQAFGTDCTSCHTTDTWRTKKVEHARTAFPLTGAHATAPCASCHVKPAMQVRLASGKCSTCHADVHKGGFKQDCASCHVTTTFKKVPFNHETDGRFPLTGRHAALACAKCHKGAAPAAPARTARANASISVVFSGLSSSCSTCHDDVHKGTTGPACQTCHNTTEFRTVQPFTHNAALAPFLAGEHATATCRACHARNGTTRPPARPAGGATPASAPWVFKGTATTCTRCHADAHDSELGTACERCHTTGGAGYRADKFAHAATAFPLTGRHETVACRQCHANKSGAEAAAATTTSQPVGLDDTGRSLRFKGRATTCASCHKDVHLGQLDNACEKCHSTRAFALPKYTHTAKVPANLFAGRHATVACRDCHKPQTGYFPAGNGTAVRFVGSGSGCATCHQSKDAHRGALGRDCERCHTPEGWPSVSRAFHKDGLFPLEGRHLTVACASCHLDGVTKGTPTRCYDCHWIRRQDDPYQTRLGSQCESCHRPTSWATVNWNHGARTGTPLSGRHQSITCDSCHKDRRFMGGTVACSTCHMPDYQKAAQPNHAAAGFPVNCEVCHQPSHSSWNQAVFSHVGFPLVGVHATQACASCHRNNVYKGTPRDCVGCHSTDYQKTASPNHAAAGFPTSCEQCHKSTAPSWTGASFNHAASFPLVGVHASQPCATCHKNAVYKGTPRDCMGCHLANYQKTTNPNHTAAGLPTTCEQCHQPTSASWATGSFNHANVYPLVGTHATQPCVACHKNGVYKGTPRDCVGCHLANYQKTTNPNHAAAGMPTTCEQCHQQTAPAWAGAGFNHASVYPLVGTHATQACVACHKNAVYKGTPRDCVGCHLANYQKTTNPNHAKAGMPTTCEQCHQQTAPSWTGAGFNHASVYPLVGTHATQACVACHKNGVYKGTPRDCVGCHLANYQKTTNPNHAAAGMPTTCEQCHQQTAPSWAGAGFNHASVYPLVGTHATQACVACHKNGVYKGTPRDCVGCHLADYQKTTNPNHAAAGMPTTCEQCHQQTSATWTGAVFNHASVYPLVGTHATQACVACHKNGVYKGTPRDCAGCHLADYQKTTNPNHAASGFPTTCEQCHQQTSATWTGAVFNHASVFPLVGLHASQACAACHKNGVYKGTPRDCAGCHLADYQKSTNPNHTAAGFPTTCDQCHQASSSTWASSFNHNQFYPLLGRHLQQTCSACHKNNVYRGTPTACVACHQTNYNQTTNPNHMAAGFPTTCESCHKASDTAWTQGVFNHTQFPITSGRHSGIACQTCHTTANVFTVFSCTTGCHARTNTDGHHNGVSGYRYDSAACYACHPQGRGGSPGPVPRPKP